MADEKNKNANAKWDDRRNKIRELVKDRIKPDDYILKDKQQQSGIKWQLESSDQKLKELLDFGNELVTNLKVAGEMREIQRRNFEEVQKKALLHELSNESTEAIAKFNSISYKWSELKNLKEPVAMFNQLESQKEHIAELMGSKDAIIESCQQEINRVSDKYYSDQDKQAAEICSLIERIDSQVELIKQAYKHHLDLLQDAIAKEHLNKSKTESSRWLELFKAMKINEAYKLEIDKEKETSYVDQIEKICREHQEITRDTRIRLECDAEALQLELRSTQNNVLMNSEKLDYNYHVLQKKNEENIIISNQQKRRVAKFKETISAYKAKILTINGKEHGTIKKMSLDIEKLYTNISELEKKSQHFLEANEKKFRHVWNLNYQEALSLTNRIYEIDRLLHAQQLGADWVPQHVKGIIYHPIENITTGKVLMSLTADRQESEKDDNKSTSIGKIDSEKFVELNFFRSILKRICDRAGFLIEEKLLEILEPYTDEEKCLVRIDNIFNALRITKYRDISSLTEYFLPFAWCPNCSNKREKEIDNSLCDYSEIDHSQQGRPSLAMELEKIIIKTSSQSESNICSVSTEDIELNITSILTGKKDSGKFDQESARQNVCTYHYLVMKPAFVITALRNFTENCLKKNHGARLGSFERAVVRSSKSTLTSSTRNSMKCWSNFLQVMPDEKQKLWKTLEHGLDHYLDVLKEREQLDIDCHSLRRQNNELRHILQKHLLSAI